MERRPDPKPREDEALREEDVTAGDRLDDRVSESDGLPDVPRVLPEDRDR